MISRSLVPCGDPGHRIAFTRSMSMRIVMSSSEGSSPDPSISASLFGVEGTSHGFTRIGLSPVIRSCEHFLHSGSKSSSHLY